MLKQISLLSRVQLCNLFGLNEIRNTRDKKKKLRFAGMTVVWLFLILLLVFYMVILCNAFVGMGMAQIIPIYLYMITSLVILFFSFFKAASMIFQMNSFELLISLPVSRAAIVISRFLTMYVTNLLLSIIVMVPGIVIYGAGVHPGISFYLYSVIGTLFLPMLPMTLSTAVGAAITAISARMKHKSLISSLLTVGIAIAAILFSTVFSGGASTLTEEMVKNLAQVMTEQISAAYPPAAWFGRAVVEGSLVSFLLLLLISAGVFGCMVAVLQKYFLTICSALNATSAKNNYKLQSLSVGSPVKALWKKEVKRYFSSSVYVSNTMIGYIMMAMAAAALMIAGPQRVEALLGLPQVMGKALPVFLGVLAGIMPITSCSISLEGKHWWRTLTLPLPAKTVFDSKILLNLAVAAPFYLIAVIAASIAEHTSVLRVVWIVVIPAIYILFTSVLGITVNLAVPVLNWENEVRVVKQSASTMFTMLLGTLSSVPVFLCLFLVPSVSADLIYAVTAVVLLVVTAVLYRRNNRADLAAIR